jgi:hypothetical protein
MEYTEPTIIDHGALADLTAANTDGENLDQDFPAGTPRGELTFS